MIKILILDDTKIRHEIFNERYNQQYKNALIKNVYSYFEFVNEWNSDDWDLVHLDHDLGDDHKADQYEAIDGSLRPYNGQDVVQFIIDEVNKGKHKPSVIVHSVNTTGGKWMLHDLLKNHFDAIWQPFSM